MSKIFELYPNNKYVLWWIAFRKRIPEINNISVRNASQSANYKFSRLTHDVILTKLVHIEYMLSSRVRIVCKWNIHKLQMVLKYLNLADFYLLIFIWFEET